MFVYDIENNFFGNGNKSKIINVCVDFFMQVEENVGASDATFHYDKDTII